MAMIEIMIEQKSTSMSEIMATIKYSATSESNLNDIKAK
jgi:hypothetical protein